MATEVNDLDVNLKKSNTFWRIVHQCISWIFKIVLILAVIAILTPAVYIAWRAGHPMEQPAFSGKTLYQVFAVRRQTYDALEAQYRQAYPQKKITHEMCFWTDIGFNIPVSLIVGYETVRAYFNPRMNFGAVVPKNIEDILPAWWSNYEMMLLSQYNHMRPVPYCNIAPPMATTK